MIEFINFKSNNHLLNDPLISNYPRIGYRYNGFIDLIYSIV